MGIRYGDVNLVTGVAIEPECDTGLVAGNWLVLRTPKGTVSLVESPWSHLGAQVVARGWGLSINTIEKEEEEDEE